MIFQQFNLVPRLDVADQRAARPAQPPLHARSTCSASSRRDERIHGASTSLERLGIAQTALQRAGTLSGGQQQRVAIARALMQEPQGHPRRRADRLARSDERQDRHGRAARHQRRDGGITVVTNLHTLDTARSYCDRIIGMARRPGRLRRHARGTDHPGGPRDLRRRRRSFSEAIDLDPHRDARQAHVGIAPVREPAYAL